MVLNTEWTQVEVIELFNDGSGLAFGITGGRSTGVVVKTIVPGGVADRDGRLQSGDHILQIGEINLRGLGSDQVASILRQCGIHVKMIIARPIEYTLDTHQIIGSHGLILPTKILGDPLELHKHIISNGYTQSLARKLPSKNNARAQLHSTSNYTMESAISSGNLLQNIHSTVDVVCNPLPIGNVPEMVSSNDDTKTKNNKKIARLPLDMAVQPQKINTVTPQDEIDHFCVELAKRNDLGLGLTVAGYVCEKEEISGVFIKRILSEEIASKQKHQIQINDRIVKVNGISIIGYTNHEAVEMLRNAGPNVILEIERYLRGPKFDQLQQAIKESAKESTISMSPFSLTVSSLPKLPLSQVEMGYAEVDADETSFGFNSTNILENSNVDDEVEIVIDCSFENGDILRRWKNKTLNAEIVIVEIKKEENCGLGISLEGTVEIENGKEINPRHYIRNILMSGPIGRSGKLRIGDELLEVNGEQLLGLSHLKVVYILKQLQNLAKLVCARYAVPLRIIDTSQHLDAFRARKIIADSLQSLLPLTHNEKLDKAKSETSLTTSTISSSKSDGTNSFETTNINKLTKSLENISIVPIWSNQYTSVKLEKSDHGLGFSILDYKHPLNSKKSVIVIRSLVSGGVAEADGRILPGDRLISVNDINLEDVTLDYAVNLLKSSQQKDKPIFLKIAKLKHQQQCNKDHSESSVSEDDQTGLEDFQECIEEYQECCLEIFTSNLNEDDNSLFDCSAIVTTTTSTSQIEDSRKVQQLQQPFNSTNYSDNTGANNNNHNNNHNNDVTKYGVNRSDNSVSSPPIRPTDSITISSNQDGYETCLDESLSDEVLVATKTIQSTSPYLVEKDSTPKNINVDLLVIQSETSNIDHCDNVQIESDDKSDSDEFFLVEYPPTQQNVEQFQEAVVLSLSTDIIDKKTTYHLKEYYNDYEDCLETYQTIKTRIEFSDSLIFDDIIVPFKSNSAPNLTYFRLSSKDGVNNALQESSNIPDDSLSVEMIDRRRKSDCGGSGDRRQFESQNQHIYQENCINSNCYNKSKKEKSNNQQIILMKERIMTPTSTSTTSSSISNSNNNNISTKIIPPITTDGILFEKHWSQSCYIIQVVRDLRTTSLGISIVGGKVASNSDFLGIFVKSIVPDSPAGRTGQFKIGDRILEVSGVDLRNATHQKAVDAIRNSPNPVVFKIQPLNVDVVKNEPEPRQIIENNTKIPKIEILPENGILEKEIISTNNLLLNDKNVAYMDESFEEDSDEDEEDNRELEGRTMTAKGQQIDRTSAGNLKRSREDCAADPDVEDEFGYTPAKVKKKYANLGYMVRLVEIERTRQGLGLSLAGHKDRNCMAVFVCGLNPSGVAHKMGQVQIGDEILEVNGIVLHGRCHLNASAIIKGLSGPIFKIIIFRREKALDDIAVKPLTQFPVSLVEEISVEQFSNTYPNVRAVSMKKTTHSLGIMIIEGKHANVGQGIFISDIQDGSSAQKAGLEIGEMILAVNKDSLLGSNYDIAASLLKRTEGLVILIVSNPSEKNQANGNVLDDNGIGDTSTNIHNENDSSKLPVGVKTQGPPSRPTTPIPDPPPDPAICPITPGKECTIEINSEGKMLGLYFIGGKDTHIPNGIILVDVYQDCAAHKDNRLQPGDQILEANSVNLKGLSNLMASVELKQKYPKMKLIVFRPENIDYQNLTVNLIKKQGKGLGLSVVVRKVGKGVYIREICSGGVAELEGHLKTGDLLIEVNGQNVENLPIVDVGIILKTVPPGRVTLNVNRYKAYR